MKFRNSQCKTFFLIAVLAHAAICHETVGDELGVAVRSSIESVADSIVRIRTIGSSGGDELVVSSKVTTGVIVSERGEVVTSSFGFGGQPATILVEDSKGDRVAARIVATDHLRKLVLLQCEEGQFQPARFAQTRWPAIGAYSIAAGRLYPGPSPAASVGVISAIRRIHGIAIQTDAKVSPVNYGGPLLDLTGAVTGILVPLSPRDTGEGINAGVEWYDSGIGFAIPAVDVLETIALLRSGEDRINGRLGVAFSTENPLAETFAISAVHPSSPADQVGLKKGDIILSANDIPCGRFGILQSVIKSSYANNTIKLEIQRGDKQTSVELRLAEKLEKLSQAFLGLVPVRRSTADGQPAISCVVLPDTPLASTGAPSRILITKWNGKAVKSLAAFEKEIKQTRVGVATEITFVTPADEAKQQQVSVVPIERPLQPLTAVAELIAAVYRTDETTSWKRSEQEIDEGNGKVWYFGPVKKEVEGLGLVVLLSDSTTAQEVVVRRWREICELHNLMIAVPLNQEGQPLSREDKDLLVSTVKIVSKGRNIDSDRIILVTNKAEAELCAELLLSPRLRQFRAAAFVETWPRVTGIPAQTLGAKSPSVLVLNGIVQSRTEKALRNSSLKSISDAGGSVIQSQLFGDTQAEQTIAIWAFGLKAR